MIGPTSWRTVSIVLGVICLGQAYRACARPTPPRRAECGAMVRADTRAPRAELAPSRDPVRDVEGAGAPPPASQLGDGTSMFGVRLPGWTRSLVPQAGEDLRAYRDRMIPLAQLALAPQRSRVARSLDDLARVANLDERERAELDAAARDTAQAIEDRLFDAVLSGELQPATFKPMVGVAVARDVLELVDRGNKRFVGALRPEQRTALANHPFDFADYLVFSTRWEDAISGL